MRILSAATDGQPRHQHRPLTTASHHTIARRPPKPLEAHRARKQRQLKAILPQSHPTKGLHNDELPIKLIESQRHHNYPLQLPREHLERHKTCEIGQAYKRLKVSGYKYTVRPYPGIGAEMSQDRKRGCYPPLEYFTTDQEKEDSPAAQTTQQKCNQFKGCLQHTSKGDS